MKGYSRIILTAIISIGIALGLSFIMQSMDKERQTSSADMVHVTNHNLVDFISSVQLMSKLARVDWSNAVLTVDLAWTDETARSVIYDDYVHLLASAFLQTENIEQVYIRTIKYRSKHSRSKEIIEWLQADRNHFLVQEYLDWLNRRVTSEEWIKTRFDVKDFRA